MVIFSLEMCLLSTPYLVQKPYYFNLGSIDIVLPYTTYVLLKRRKVGCNIIMRRNNTNMSSGLLYLPLHPPPHNTKVCLHPLPTHCYHQKRLRLQSLFYKHCYSCYALVLLITVRSHYFLFTPSLKWTQCSFL